MSSGHGMDNRGFAGVGESSSAGKRGGGDIPMTGTSAWSSSNTAASGQKTITAAENGEAAAYGDLSPRTFTEVQDHVDFVNNDLVRHFQPIFQQRGRDGIPIREVEEEIRKVQQAKGLRQQSRDVIATRLQRADVNKDNVITYQEFMAMMTEDLKAERKRALKAVFLSAAMTVGLVKKQEHHDFLANYRFCPPPLFIPIITIIQIIIFAVYAVDMKKHNIQVTANEGYPNYTSLYYKPEKRQEAWRFLTYMFIHKGYMHLVLNMVIQLLFGIPLELVHGWWRVGIIYLTGVVSGSLAHSVVDSVGLVGASGGGYAIFGAHVAAVVINWSEMNYRVCGMEDKMCCFICRIVLSAPVRMCVVLMIVIAETALAVHDRITAPEGSKVGITAHIGGFLTGLFLGIRVLKNVLLHPWESILGWVTLGVYLAVCLFAILFNIFYKE